MAKVQPHPSTGYNFVPTLRDDAYDFVDPRKLDMSGRNVMITGASKGVGKAMAIAFGQAGASGIVLAARSSLEEVSKEVIKAAVDNGRPAPQVLSLRMDTTSRAEVEAAAAKVSNDLKHIDVLINNAGYLEPFTPVADSDPDEWWKTFEVNVKGVYLTTRSFLPLVLNSAFKTIIQVSSIGAHNVLPGASAYQTTKLAVLKFNAFLMAEYEQQGLVAYGIHPGGVMTELARNMPADRHYLLKDTPELCGAVVPWLASEKRDWLAERYVSVTWDMQEFLRMRDEIVDKDLLKVRMRV